MKHEKVILVMCLVVIVVSFGWLMRSCREAAKELDQVGLKGAIEELWYGKQGKEGDGDDF